MYKLKLNRFDEYENDKIKKYIKKGNKIKITKQIFVICKENKFLNKYL